MNGPSSCCRGRACAYNGLSKIKTWTISVETSYHAHLRSARQAEQDKQTAFLITVMLRPGKYEDDVVVLPLCCRRSCSFYRHCRRPMGAATSAWWQSKQDSAKRPLFPVYCDPSVGAYTSCQFMVLALEYLSTHSGFRRRAQTGELGHIQQTRVTLA